MNQEQLLKQQGWSDDSIQKFKTISSNPEAYQHALKTGDLQGAFDMCQPKAEEKLESHNLVDFFGSFANELPEDAKSLSIALSKFSRWVQSQTDKNKEST